MLFLNCSSDNMACLTGTSHAQSIKCICKAGYTGENCTEELNECDSSPCSNNGSCDDMRNGFECQCNGTGFEGSSCEIEIDECASSPCNGIFQACVDLVNAFTCNCTGTGFTGARCDTDIDECLSNPCPSGAPCVDQPNAYRCNCANITGYWGDDCDRAIVPLRAIAANYYVFFHVNLTRRDAFFCVSQRRRSPSEFRPLASHAAASDAGRAVRLQRRTRVFRRQQRLRRRVRSLRNELPRVDDVCVSAGEWQRVCCVLGATGAHRQHGTGVHRLGARE